MIKHYYIPPLDYSSRITKSNDYYYIAAFTSLISNMKHLFYLNRVFTPSELIEYKTNIQPFNQPLDGWVVNNVTNMEGMFLDCIEFNQPLDAWNDRLKNVTNMEEMFKGCINFKQDLNGWIIDEENVNTKNMFQNSGLCTEWNNANSKLSFKFPFKWMKKSKSHYCGGTDTTTEITDENINELI
jgi:hypothetical protein